jgi:hypothetical protein
MIQNLRGSDATTTVPHPMIFLLFLLGMAAFCLLDLFESG